MQLPKDPNMLLSVVNTKLRDEYPSLSELSKAYGAEKNDIEESLGALGFVYDESLNRFIAK